MWKNVVIWCLLPGLAAAAVRRNNGNRMWGGITDSDTGDGGTWPGTGGDTATGMPGGGGGTGEDGGTWPGAGGVTATGMPDGGGGTGGDGGTWPGTGGDTATGMPGGGGGTGGDGGTWPGAGGDTATGMPGGGGGTGGDGGTWPGAGGDTATGMPGEVGGTGDGGMWLGAGGDGEMWPGKRRFKKSYWPNNVHFFPNMQWFPPTMYPPNGGGGGGGGGGWSTPGMSGGIDGNNNWGGSGWFPPMFTTTITPAPTCSSVQGECVTECGEGLEADEDYTCDVGVCCLPSVFPNLCGRKSMQTRIVGGNVATPHSYPWQVSLQRDSGFHFCGGSLITDTWVVTAAHCMDSGVGRILLGEHNHDIANKPEVVMGASKVIVHEDYSSGVPYPNDIALIKLDFPVNFTAEVSPACVPTPGQEFSKDDDCWISGWGDTRGTGNETILNELRIHITDNSNCSDMWGGSYIKDTHICVGYGDIGACNGDSGGPLSCQKDSKWMLAGATSWGYNGCQEAGKPNVYTRVSEYRSWIVRNIRNNSN